MALAPVNPVQKKQKKSKLAKLVGVGSFAMDLASMGGKLGLFGGASKAAKTGSISTGGGVLDPSRFDLYKGGF